MPSSPRRRGSSVLRLRDGGAGLVLPAQAGVFRGPTSARATRGGPPRAGGGLPYSGLWGAREAESSPRRRGSSAVRDRRVELDRVLPAQAGVFRRRSPRRRGGGRPPRAGGGLPPRRDLGDLTELSSPRRRGSSDAPRDLRDRPAVLPAQAGVFRSAAPAGTSLGRPPRAGGGLPAGLDSSPASRVSSPRRRGSSEAHRRRRAAPEVLPAQAGVFRSPGRWRTRSRRPPRAGGGAALSSPRRRGSSRRGPSRPHRADVLPAQAGVFRPCRRPRRSAPGPPRAGGGLP